MFISLNSCVAMHGVDGITTVNSSSLRIDWRCLPSWCTPPGSSQVDVDELAPDQVFVAVYAPAAVRGLEYREFDVATFADEPCLATGSTIALVVAFVDGVALLQVEGLQGLDRASRLRIRESLR